MEGRGGPAFPALDPARPALNPARPALGPPAWPLTRAYNKFHFSLTGWGISKGVAKLYVAPKRIELQTSSWAHMKSELVWNSMIPLICC